MRGTTISHSVEIRRHPTMADFPHTLELARLGVLDMSYERYEYDEGRLVSTIRKILGTGER